MTIALGRTALAFGLALFLGPIILRPQQPPSLTPSPPPAPADQSHGDSYSAEPYVFELIEKKIRFDPDGRGQHDSTFLVRVQSEAAVREFGLLVYPFAAAFETLDVNYARVRKPDGTVVDTPASDIQELDSAVSREAPMYTDQREKHIAVKSLSVGDVLEVQLRWTVHDPIAPGYFWFDDSYFREGICLKQVFEFRLPKNVPVKFRYSNPQPEIRDEGETRIYTFQSSHLAKEPESKIPAWEKNFHGLDPPDLRMSSFDSWEDLGKWFGNLQQSKSSVTPEILAKAEELTKGKPTEDEKIRALYDFVSLHFRYIGVALGSGRYSPHSAAEVLANRYGDCKDKHTLVAALLQAVGIPSFPVLIGTKYRLDPELPSVSTVDHVITAIPRANSLLFLDTTPEVAPFGFLLQPLRDRQALVIPANASAYLASTPPDPPFPVGETFHSDATVDKKGNLDAKVQLENRGDTEVVLRSIYRATPQNRWQELTQNLVARLGFGGTVSNVSIGAPEDTSKSFSIRYDYHRQLPDWKENRLVVPLPPMLFQELNDEQKLSKAPLPLGSPQEITYDSTIKFPNGFSVIPPQNHQRVSNFAEFSAKYSVEKSSTLHATIHLKTLSPEVPGDKRSAYSDLVKTAEDSYAQYVFFRTDLSEDASLPIPFENGSALPLGPMTGFVANNIPLLEKALEANPDNRKVILLLAGAYTKAGRPKDAIALVEKSIGDEDTSGGQFSFALGEAYLALPDLEKAFAQFQKALGDDPDAGLLNDVAWDLADAGIHLKEALDFSTRAVADVSSQTVFRSAEDTDPSDFARMLELAAYWDTLGWVHFRLGNLPEAEKYLLAAWQLEQSGSIGEHLVEVYEKLGKSRKAAEVCLMALATPLDSETKDKLSKQAERLKPYVKTSVGGGAMALSDFRTLPVAFHAKLKGNSSSAHFVISITNDSKADEVVFSSGAEELRGATAVLSSLHYPQSFPDNTLVRVLRKAILSCSVYTKDCPLILLPIRDASVPGH